MNIEPTVAEDYLFGHCDSCNGEVLTHTRFDEAGNEVQLCVRCDGVIVAGLHVGDSEDLTNQGYALYEESKGGCGGGCSGGSCGRPS